MSVTPELRGVLWGTYDTGKPRVRILRRGLRENGVHLDECHVDVWSAIADKSQLKGTLARLGVALRWVLAYPRLAWRYARLPRHDFVVVGYLGHLDVLAVWPLARLRGVPVVWDAFLSLHETVVEDRRLLAAGGFAARLLHAWERLACRAADLVVLDTRAHAEHFVREYGVDPARLVVALVGAEPEAFAVAREEPAACRVEEAELEVLFYGQLIPLHGVPVIVEAARRLAGEAVRWTLVGTGQGADSLRRMLTEVPLPRLRWVEWLDYGQLAAAIRAADVGLGIFGTSRKASMVIPNKVFQVLAAGRPVITRDSAAIRELPSELADSVLLVPAGDPGALAAVIRRLAADPRELVRRRPGATAALAPRAVSRPVVDAVADLLNRRARRAAVA